MNPVLMICYNNLELTMQAVESVLTQSIPTHLILIDNGSTYETEEWADRELSRLANANFFRLPRNTPVVQVANIFVADIFKESDYVLGVPNDVILHPTLYEEFLKWPRGIVTGSEMRDREEFDKYSQDLPQTVATSENTPMAVMLTRKWCYDALIAKDGYFFDERYTHYASDCDLALRIASCGIRGIQLNTPYWHYGSASHRLASDGEQQIAHFQADMDRAKFLRKWGFRVTDLEYGQRANDLNFKG